MSRRWIITGASRGLGLAAARAAIARGDRVALLARGESVRETARSLGPAALGLQADVADPQQIEAAVAEVARQWGGVDVLVNNAGLHRGGRIDRLQLADWDAVLDTNLSGPVRVVRAALPHLGQGSSIVNIGAVVGFRGFKGDSAYGASKAGLAGLTAVLATELAERGIRVNLVIPGFVLTAMTAGISERAQAALLARIPLGRIGTEDEIAEVIWWVAGSTYMTGAVIPTDGGLMSSL